MLFVVILVIPKQESVSLVTTKTHASLVALELDLVLEDILIRAAHVETRLVHLSQIMAKSILRQWDIFWCSKKKLIWAIKFAFGAKRKLANLNSTSCSYFVDKQ